MNKQVLKVGMYTAAHLTFSCNVAKHEQERNTCMRVINVTNKPVRRSQRYLRKNKLQQSVWQYTVNKKPSIE